MSKKKNLNSRAPKLQKDFGLKLIEKELELDSSPSLEALEEVINLYSRAVEYYEHKKDPIYFDYQERMHKLLVRPEILRLMKGEKSASQPTSPRNFASKESISLKKRTLERNKIQMINQLASQSSQMVKNNMKRLVERYNKNSRTVTSKAMVNMKAQESELRRKLTMRNKKNVLFTFSPRVLTSNCSFDSLSDIDEQPEDFGRVINKLEKIAEERKNDRKDRIISVTSKLNKNKK